MTTQYKLLPVLPTDEMMHAGAAHYYHPATPNDIRRIWDAMVEVAPPLQKATEYQRSAPERIWLNVFNGGEPIEAFPDDHGEITWADSEVGDQDVPYARADLAALTDAARQIATLQAQVEGLEAALRDSAQQYLSLEAQNEGLAVERDRFKAVLTTLGRKA